MDTVVGEQPPHEVAEDDFVWMDGLKSTHQPIDPWKIGLRKRITRHNDSLHEIEELELVISVSTNCKEQN